MKTPTKDKRRSDLIGIASAIAFLACGLVMWFVGQSTSYTPMIMAALLMLCFTVLILLNTLLPMLLTLCEKYCVKDNAKKTIKSILGFFPRHGNIISLIINVVICVWYAYIYYLYAVFNEQKVSVGYVHVFVLGMTFIVMLIGGKICKYYVSEQKSRSALCSVFAVLNLNSLALTAGAAVQVIGIYDTFKIMKWVEVGFGAYCALFILISLISGFIRKELCDGVNTVIPLPFVKGEKTDENLIDYIENNTGITLRSLFSIKYAKAVLPAAVFALFIFFWFSTGLVTVEPHQQGALYRFGRCEDILEPGLHLTLPWPLDKVDVYDTGKIRETVVGYDSDRKTDILWSESHGGTEYKLLLGEGNELVSVNIRLQYKIDDLYEYVTASANAEKILNARAYSVVTDMTIGTTLDVIISEDRDELAVMIENALAEYLDSVNIGIAVVDVVIESIHPPVEVANVYQDFIAAEIQAQKSILDAESKAIQRLADANTAKETLINFANIDYHQKTAAATTELAEFMAAISATAEYPDEYKYYKYLDAICRAYKNARLVIVGNDVDSSRLYFGSIPTATN
jgi:regulator of protease activity HflC (stomatin/prohibitin superfamily)